MSNKIVLTLLAIAGLFTVSIIFFSSFAQLIEYLVNFGFIPHNSKIARGSTRAQNARAISLIQALNIPEEYLHRLRGSLIEGLNPTHVKDDQLSFNLLRRLKSCIRQLDGEEFYYDNLRDIYVDSMGSMYNKGHGDTDLSRYLHQWLVFLHKEGVIPTPHCLLGNKEGSVSIVQRLQTRLTPADIPSIGLIIAKSKNDRSRIKRSDNSIPHRTDFEGLETFLMKIAENGYNTNSAKQNIIFVDDNCTGAQNMCEAITSFNKLIDRESLPFNKIKDAIVLFAIKTDSDNAKTNCDQAGIRLHSILSLGGKELKSLLIYNRNQVHDSISEFKTGFGCEISREKGL